jgi:hypothetical protein
MGRREAEEKSGESSQKGMSTPRALANQKLYHAKILIRYWQTAIAEENIAKTVLEQAFGSAVRDHLIGAYGWFLLEISQPDEMPEQPPHCADELPAITAGRETPPEINEFLQLEREGWLSKMLNPNSTIEPSAVPSNPSSQNLATLAGGEYGPEEALRWHDELGALFGRMTDSLDEY